MTKYVFARMIRTDPDFEPYLKIYDNDVLNSGGEYPTEIKIEELLNHGYKIEFFQGDALILRTIDECEVPEKKFWEIF